MRKKNILYILVDSLRADRLNFHGFKHSTSPFLNELSSKSYFCKSAFTAGNPTEFALPSLLASSNLLDNGGFANGISNREITLPEVLRRNGYETAAFFSCYERSSSSYARGFDFAYHLYDLNRICKDVENAIPFYQRMFAAQKMSFQDCLGELSPLVDVWFKDAVHHCEHPPIKSTSESILHSRIFDFYNYENVLADIESEYGKFINDNEGYLESILNGQRFALLDILYSHVANRGKKGKSTFQEVMCRINLALNFYRGWFASATYKASKEVLAISLERVLGGLQKYIKFPSGKYFFETFKNWNNHRERSDKPFFAFLHIQDIHELNHTTYDIDGFEDFKKRERTTYRHAMKKISKGKDYIGNTLYDASIAYVDLLVEDLYNYLEDKGLSDNTLIVFTADHGHLFPRLPIRESISHPDDFFDELYHVPLLIFDPSRAHEVNENLTSSIDIAPTLLDMVGIDIPDSFKGRVIHKEDAREFVTMENQGRGPCSINKKHVHVCVRSNKQKVIYSSMKDEPDETFIRAIFNLQSDKEEYINLKEDTEALNDAAPLLRIAKQRVDEIYAWASPVKKV